MLTVTARRAVEGFICNFWYSLLSISSIHHLQMTGSVGFHNLCVVFLHEITVAFTVIALAVAFAVLK